MPRDEAALFGVELYNLRVCGGQVVYAAHRRIQQHLVDVTGGDSLFIEHRTDVQTFRHRDIIEVLDFCDGLANAETLCGQTSEDVRLAAVRHGYKRVCVLDAFFFEHIHV